MSVIVATVESKAVDHEDRLPKGSGGISRAFLAETRSRREYWGSLASRISSKMRRSIYNRKFSLYPDFSSIGRPALKKD